MTDKDRLLNSIRRREGFKTDSISISKNSCIEHSYCCEILKQMQNEGIILKKKDGNHHLSPSLKKQEFECCDCGHIMTVYYFQNKVRCLCGRNLKIIWKKKDFGFEKIKEKARIKANNKLEIPENLLCQRCGENNATIKHHEDYGKPLMVIFLCSECHSEVHTEGVVI